MDAPVGLQRLQRLLQTREPIVSRAKRIISTSVMSSETSHLTGWMEGVREHRVGQRTNQTIAHDLHGEVAKQDMMNDLSLRNDMRHRNKRELNT